jgi:MFS transporter, CP family, cyanate transporter
MNQTATPPAAMPHAPRDLDLADELLIDAEADDAGVQAARPAAHRLWIVLGLVCVAFNLRPALSSVAPVLAEIQRGTGLSATLAGVLTTAPVLCLGVFGPLAPRLARRSSAEAVVAAFLLVLAAGLALRGVGSVPALFLGMILSGAAIGVIGVLVPGLIKRDFPGHAALMTGLYTMVLCLGAAAGAGMTVPFERTFGVGWGGALMLWAVPAVMALLAWTPQILGGRPAHSGPGKSDFGRLLRDPLAWQVTGYMGLQSSLAYTVFGWMPVVLRDRGLDAFAAGWMSSASVMAQTVTALAVPMLAGRVRDQRLLVILVLGAAAAGWVGIALGPMSLVAVWSVILGLGLGGTFGLALTMIVLRSRDAHTAAQLSGMAQSVGYTVASLGPFGVGLARDWSGGWAAPTALFAALAAGALVCGLGAGRARFVLADGPPHGR